MLWFGFLCIYGVLYILYIVLDTKEGRVLLLVVKMPLTADNDDSLVLSLPVSSILRPFCKTCLFLIER